MGQAIQIIGSLCVLIPFILVQMERLRPDNVVYVTFNALGSSTLAVLAAVDHQWGFLLLEGVWALVSLHSLLRLGRTMRASSEAQA
ncbi:membrane protein of unknown function [Modestobacter italicus]|uniref:CBU-0592-like domain-containing protein n=1 Tax=Modestobacter italicus (strain DSM 44449 / CECT 9708 / BC 501) TaxID=2732864 RepID=I4F0E4_MODI5|nr:hypothetical protein [Modestobacter marinus]CCH89107.1 membrane protein of unknown function [Modestobacter marinus]